MWTKEARIQHVPRKERYPSDMTDMEWAIIAPLIPPQRPGDRHRETDMREAMNAVRYVLRTGCQWRQLPKDFPPRSTVYNYFWEWTRYGVLDRIHHILRVKVREMEGRVRPHRRRLCQARNDVHHAQAACQPKAQPRNVKFRVRL